MQHSESHDTLKDTRQARKMTMILMSNDGKDNSNDDDGDDDDGDN
jgi:hypothetical protein